ncbi:nitroreductase family deazaflavin-dependent oxidoreductase [Amycolatopsis magusensis]|uniref:nitroreductase family deazaflavin-dependent oxidoreductase n=1 Tax=Amycolatopsis magusensis TaxID=882444 RepID=UPI0024A819D9|nr:nitroreductase family deazaflavin-dependent oxidoreductase [Amycolatopsis magusensis]MDI5981081.1 nitroreductase family deazaflavin-dependent oxidoreductase [Amycolatopsis magusensis]
MAQPTDSPTKWVAQHVQRYVETGGEQGGVFHGVPALLLTTRGRKSGRLRRTALYYGEDDGRYVVVASNGGAAKHPAWYLNLTAEPEVTVQVGADEFTALAQSAEGAEWDRLWEMMADIFPTYRSYRTKTDREIPLVVLTRK